MTNQPPGLEFRGVECYRSAEDPATFYYVPAEPQPEKDPAGNPQISLLASDKGAILQLGTRWTVDDETLSDLRKFLAGKFPELSPKAIQLKPATISVKGVTLLLGDGRGNFEELKTEVSAGYLPFNTVFNVQLTSAQKERVISAFKGRKGALAVRYRGTLSTPATASTSIEGDVGEDVSQVGPDATPDELLDQTKRAVSEGRLNVEQTGEAPDELADKSRRMAEDEVAAMIRRMTGRERPRGTEDKSTLKADVTLRESYEQPLERSADVSAWFPGGKGGKHVQYVPVSLPEPS